MTTKAIWLSVWVLFLARGYNWEYNESERMKKNVVFVLSGFLLLFVIPLRAQVGFEIVPYTGYMIGGQKSGYVLINNESYNARYKIENGQNWGLSAGVNAGEVKFIFLYNRLDSKLTRNTPAYEGKKDLTDLATEYFNVGAIKEVGLNDVVKPFGLYTIGATVFTPKNSDYYTEWLFSMTLGGGLRIYLMEHFAIQLQARILMPMLFGGGGLWCGTGGCSVGVEAYSAIVQGDIGGGLVISF